MRNIAIGVILVVLLVSVLYRATSSLKLSTSPPPPQRVQRTRTFPFRFEKFDPDKWRKERQAELKKKVAQEAAEERHQRRLDVRIGHFFKSYFYGLVWLTTIGTILWGLLTNHWMGRFLDRDARQGVVYDPALLAWLQARHTGMIVATGILGGVFFLELVMVRTLGIGWFQLLTLLSLGVVMLTDQFIKIRIGAQLRERARLGI